MKVGIIQSNYIPWRGYFDFIHDCDAFVFLDDVQYTRRDWRNRNKIKTLKGPRWITVPVQYAPVDTPIDRIQIDYATGDWRRRHLGLFYMNYCRAPFYHDAMYLLESALDIKFGYLSLLNQHLTTRICTYLGIATRLLDARRFYCGDLRKTDRLLHILKQAGATSYLSGPAAQSYMEEQKLEDAGIKLVYKSYAYPMYPQQHGEFNGNLSILDLIANVGKDAPKYIWGDK